MEYLIGLLEQLIEFIPTAITVVAVIMIAFALRLLFSRRFGASPGHQFRLHLILLVLFIVGLLAVILTLPTSDTMTGQLLTLFGLILSAAIALSATTFLGNVLAGFMLRGVGNFRIGDFLRVGDHFGRVSERGLFHVEIQTEDRDLTTIPNLHLVTNPVKVVRSTGTLVTAGVSLGYDVPRGRIEQALLRAAEDTKLDEPFVQILDLNDYSVSYRISGLLSEVKTLISVRSRLRGAVLDQLHAAGIEIVSPTFMNQRVLEANQQFIPKRPATRDAKEEKKIPESLVFDKAEEAESLENLRARRRQILDDIESLKKQAKSAETDTEKAELEKRIQSHEERAERLALLIKTRESEKG